MCLLLGLLFGLLVCSLVGVLAGLLVGSLKSSLSCPLAGLLHDLLNCLLLGLSVGLYFVVVGLMACVFVALHLGFSVDVCSWFGWYVC